MTTSITEKFYSSSFKKNGANAQRKYPNEELCRFIGRNFSHLPIHEKRHLKILETGCGTGGNLWMLAKEGFDTYGIDFSSDALTLTKLMLEKHQVEAKLFQQDMTNLQFDAHYFDIVVDVFSSNCLDRSQGLKYLASVKKILKKDGLFFSYFPCKSSGAFQSPGNAKLIDPDTLEGIYRKNSPFTGQHYPFRFLYPDEYEELLNEFGFSIQYSETLTRSYNNHKENFSWCVIEAKNNT